MILHRILISLRIFLAGRLRDQVAVFIIFISCFFIVPWSPVCLFRLGNELVGIIILIGIFLNGLALGDFFICSPVACRIVFIAVCSCTFIFFLLGTLCQLPVFIIFVCALCRDNSDCICSVFIMLAVMLISMRIFAVMLKGRVLLVISSISLKYKGHHNSIYDAPHLTNLFPVTFCYLHH